MADNIAPAIYLFFPLYCDIISLTSLKITQAFHLLLGCAEKLTVFWDFYILNSVRIIEVLLYHTTTVGICYNMYLVLPCGILGANIEANTSTYSK